MFNCWQGSLKNEQCNSHVNTGVTRDLYHSYVNLYDDFIWKSVTRPTQKNAYLNVSTFWKFRWFENNPVLENGFRWKHSLGGSTHVENSSKKRVRVDVGLPGFPVLFRLRLFRLHGLQRLPYFGRVIVNLSRACVWGDRKTMGCVAQD